MTAPSPRTLPRRFERWLMGAVMAVVAFLLEKIVMRSIRMAGGGAAPEAGTPMQSRGASIEG